MLAWRDDDVLVDSDNDGIANNDRDTELNTMLFYACDLDDSIDADGNGNFIDDWMTDEEFPGRMDAIWNETGEYVVRLKVCDDTLVCTIQTLRLQSGIWIPKMMHWVTFLERFAALCGFSKFVYIILIALVLTLGWLVMRDPKKSRSRPNKLPALR